MFTPPASVVESAFGTGSPLFARVMTIRERVYGDEIGHPRDALRDDIDDHSTHFVCVRDGADVGVLRLTRGADGVLDTEEQNPEWAARLAADRGRGERVCDFTRLMVLPAARDIRALFHLARAALDSAHTSGVDRGYLAGQEKSLPLFRRLGAVVRDPVFRPFAIGGRRFGRFCLLGVDRADMPAVLAPLTRGCC